MKTVTDAEIRKEVRAALKKHDLVKVVFIKANGKQRKMTCTTRPELIPADKKPQTETVPNSEVQRVFDTGIGEWRSFRYDMLISVDAVEAARKTGATVKAKRAK